MMPDVSIVIRTFNEERFLPRLLQGIREQDHPSVEVVVVDSGSYDRTVHIAREAGARVLQIESRDFTFGYSLNAGVCAATGSKVVLVSAHTEPVGSSWLSALVAPLEQPEVAMVCGRQRGDARSKLAELWDFDRTFGEQTVDLTPRNFFGNNANAAIRRELWEDHPFDEFLPGLEDLEWARYWTERGRRVVYEPKATVYHIHEETWQQVRRRYYREAVALKQMGLREPRSIGREVFREAMYLVDDVRRGMVVPRRLPEILRFRWHKTLGTVRGLLDGAAVHDPQMRDEMYFNRTYDAVVITSPGHAALERRDIPQVKPGDVLVEVAYEGVCGTDLEVFDGTLGYFESGLSGYPIVPGHELSGWVSRAGANVSHVAEGDPVVVECIQSCRICDACRGGNPIGCARRREVGVMCQDGGYAQYLLTPAEFVHRVPQGIDLRTATLVEPIAVVHKGLRRIRFALGEGRRRCLVVGAGPIGHLAARMLALRGYEVAICDLNPSRLAPFANTSIAAMTALDDPSRFDVVVEATGKSAALQQLLTGSRAGAVLLLLGFPYGRREFNFEQVVAYDRIIVGSVGSEAEDFQSALKLLARLDVEPLLQCEYPLGQFSEAWKIQREGAALKVILAVTKER